MNNCEIIGNLTRDPELKTVNGDISVCEFNVAVNRRQRGKNEQGDADFFRVTAWRGLGESCAKYLKKGRKVYVSGPISARAYTDKSGTAKASMEITANDVEFLSAPDGAKHDEPQAPQPVPVDAGELPF